MARNPRSPSGLDVFSSQAGKLSLLPNILIVCEDTKSSKYYIEDYIQHIELPSVKVKVVAGDGSAPRNVVNTIERYLLNEEAGNPYEYIFLVIDRDHHATFDEAVDKFNTLTNNNRDKKFFAIISYPSFETWILYHFEYSRAIMECSLDVIKKIKASGLDYEKSSNDIFENTVSLIDKAIENSKCSIADSNIVGELNPSTLFHKLIDVLANIKNSKSLSKVKPQDILDVIWQSINLAYEKGIQEISLDTNSFNNLQEDIFSSDMFQETLKVFISQNQHLNIAVDKESITIKTQYL
jgi:hypothetical protein